MLLRWRKGQADLSSEHEARGRVLACEEIEGMSLHGIRLFYGLDAPAMPVKP